MSVHQKVTLGDIQADGYVIPLETCNLVFITKGNSLLACGAVDVGALEKFAVPAAAISGVSTVDDLLAGVVKAANSFASQRGVHPGDTGAEALQKL